MTLFVSDSNYSMAIIGLVDRKWLLLERLHGWRNSENQRVQEGFTEVTLAINHLWWEYSYLFLPLF